MHVQSVISRHAAAAAASTLTGNDGVLDLRRASRSGVIDPRLPVPTPRLFRSLAARVGLGLGVPATGAVSPVVFRAV